MLINVLIVQLHHLTLESVMVLHEQPPSLLPLLSMAVNHASLLLLWLMDAEIVKLHHPISEHVMEANEPQFTILVRNLMAALAQCLLLLLKTVMTVRPLVLLLVAA